jgi:hypothetical protein
VPGQELTPWQAPNAVARTSRDRRELDHYAGNIDGAAALTALRLQRAAQLRTLQQQLGNDIAEEAARAMRAKNPLQRVIAEQVFEGWLWDSNRIVSRYTNAY